MSYNTIQLEVEPVWYMSLTAFHFSAVQIEQWKLKIHLDQVYVII